MKTECNRWLKEGWWIQVSPLSEKDSGWICGIYKKSLKTGNWLTEYSRKFDSPKACYGWGDVIIESQVSKNKEL